MALLSRLAWACALHGWGEQLKLLVLGRWARRNEQARRGQAGLVSWSQPAGQVQLPVLTGRTGRDERASCGGRAGRAGWRGRARCMGGASSLSCLCWVGRAA